MSLSKKAREKMLEKKHKEELTRESDAIGKATEDRFERLLDILKGVGILVYKRTEKWDDDDKRGIDFKIWGINEYKCYFTVDVKSSKKFSMKHANRRIKGNFPFVVERRLADRQVILSFLKLFGHVSGADWSKMFALTKEYMHQQTNRKTSS